jgi:hypothetical protein
MRKKIGILVIMAFISFTLLSLFPSGICDTYWYTDLTIDEPISVTHDGSRNWHTAWVWINNEGNYPTDSFHTNLYLLVSSKNPPGLSQSLLKTWSINYIGAHGSKLKFYTFYWDNPDPNNYQARVGAFADCYDEEDELYENNNWGYSNWWA